MISLELALGLLDAGDVVEGDVGAILLRVERGPTATERQHAARASRCAHLSDDEEPDDHQHQQPGADRAEEVDQRRVRLLDLQRARVERDRVVLDDHLRGLERLPQRPQVDRRIRRARRDLVVGRATAGVGDDPEVGLRVAGEHRRHVGQVRFVARQHRHEERALHGDRAAVDVALELSRALEIRVPVDPVRMRQRQQIADLCDLVDHARVDDDLGALLAGLLVRVAPGGDDSAVLPAGRDDAAVEQQVVEVVDRRLLLHAGS